MTISVNPWLGHWPRSAFNLSNSWWRCLPSDCLNFLILSWNIIIVNRRNSVFLHATHNIFTLTSNSIKYKKKCKVSKLHLRRKKNSTQLHILTLHHSSKAVLFLYLRKQRHKFQCKCPTLYNSLITQSRFGVEAQGSVFEN